MRLFATDAAFMTSEILRDAISCQAGRSIVKSLLLNEGSKALRFKGGTVENRFAYLAEAGFFIFRLNFPQYALVNRRRIFQQRTLSVPWTEFGPQYTEEVRRSKTLKTH